MAADTSLTSSSYVLVSNIPAEYHTADLRRFFADFVEAGKFDCFHFRHRRERPRPKSADDVAITPLAYPRNDMYSRATCSRVHMPRAKTTSDEDEELAKYTTCCVVKIQERFVGKNQSNDETLYNFM